MRLFIGMLCAFCCATAGTWASDSSGTVVNPVRRDVAEWIRLPGNTEAEIEVTLYARASGFLRDFKLDVGDTIRPGDLIGVIDAPDLDQDIKQAESQVVFAKAEVLSAQAQLERVTIRSTEIDAKEAILKADVAKEKSELALATAQYIRTKKLFETNAATDLDREFKELTVKVHESSVSSSESKLAQIASERSALKKDEEAAAAMVDSAKGKLAIVEAALKRTQVLFGFTQVTVPKLGLSKQATSASVVKRFVSNGDLISGGVGSNANEKPLVTVVVNDPMRVIVDLPEGESGSVRPGTPVGVTFAALPNEGPIAGKVARISPVIMANTRSLHVEMEVDNPDGKLRAGMMAYMEIMTDVHKGVMALPATAVQRTKLGAAVYKVEDGKARRIPVDVGYADHGWIEVRSQVLDGTTAIIKDVSKGISDGALVEIAKPPVSAAAADAH